MHRTFPTLLVLTSLLFLVGTLSAQHINKMTVTLEQEAIARERAAMAFSTQLTAMGGRAARRPANARVSCIRFSGEAIWLTSPMSSASRAPILRLKRIMSRALALPTTKGSRWVPPQPGMMPRRY